MGVVNRMAIAGMATAIVAAGVGSALWFSSQDGDPCRLGSLEASGRTAIGTAAEPGGDLQELILTDAIFDATVVNVARDVSVDLAGVGSPAVYDILTITVDSVVWTLDDANLEPERSSRILYPSDGQTLMLRALDEVGWCVGGSYRLYSDHDPDFSVPWRAGFGLTTDGQVVAGLDDAAIRWGLDRITSTGLDPLTATTQLATEFAHLRQFPPHQREQNEGPLVSLLK